MSNQPIETTRGGNQSQPCQFDIDPEPTLAAKARFTRKDRATYTHGNCGLEERVDEGGHRGRCGGDNKQAVHKEQDHHQRHEVPVSAPDKSAKEFGDGSGFPEMELK